MLCRRGGAAVADGGQLRRVQGDAARMADSAGAQLCAQPRPRPADGDGADRRYAPRRGQRRGCPAAAGALPVAGQGSQEPDRRGTDVVLPEILLLPVHRTDGCRAGTDGARRGGAAVPPAAKAAGAVGR